MDTYKIAVSNHKLDHKLPPGDPMWHDFNSSFRNLDLEVQDVLDVIWNGRAITTHHKNNWRATQNYLMGQHIGLDFDNENKSSTLGELCKDKFIQKYAAFVHTTISHTEEKPRARAIFLLDQPIMQAANYGLAASALLWVFGTADRQCRDAVRFFYGSPKCEFEYINQVLPLSVVKDLIGKYKEAGETEHKRTTHKDYLPPATQQDAAAALALIDPWKIEYDEWAAILMALHGEFGDGGLTLAETWADGKPGEVERKWRSFHKEGNAAGRVTIGTVFAIAKRFGWSKN